MWAQNDVECFSLPTKCKAVPLGSSQILWVTNSLSDLAGRDTGLLHRLSRDYLVYHHQFSYTPEPLLFPARCSEVGPAPGRCLTRPSGSSLTNTCKNAFNLFGLACHKATGNSLTGCIQLLGIPPDHPCWAVRDLFGVWTSVSLKDSCNHPFCWQSRLFSKILLPLGNQCMDILQ